MKKLFLAIAAVATLLASCSKDDGLTGVSKSQVTFTVSSPEMATRAGDYGNGKQATELYYAVYDAVEGGLVSGLSKTTQDNHEQLDAEGKATVSLNLVEGRTYTIIFYAEHNFDPNDETKKSPYTIDWPKQTLTVDYQNLKANQETYDAFYAHVDNLKVGTAAINETVYLRRPFAQLNVLTNDLDKGTAAGIDIAETSVTVKNIYTKMNLFTDKVDPESEAAVTYALSDVLKDDNGAIVSAVVDNTTYHWLTMNYLLVNDKKMVDVEFTMTDSTVADSSKDNKLVRNYSTVPVERNHRTNIYGSIITNPAKFNVEIKPEFLKPDHNVNDKSNEVTVSTTDDLQDAINNAKVGERTIIKFDGDIDATTTRAATNAAAEIWVAQKDGVQIVIDGCGHEFNGSFKVHNNSTYCNATLDFVNINFKTSTPDLNFIHAVNFGEDSNGNTRRYSQNITVSDCTFEAVNNPINVVGVQVNASKNLHIINCTAKNMHSLMQAQSCDDKIQVENVTIENCSEGGVAFGNAAYPTIKNTTITNAADYGIRADGDASRGNLVIENVNISGTNVPVVVRRVTTAYNVALKGQNTLKATGLYDVVFTNGNNKEEYAKPTGKWSITGAEGLNVYPTALEEGYNASSSEQLSQAIAGGVTTVNLEAGEYTFPASKNFTAETVINCEEGTVFTGNSKLNIKGATVVGATFSNPSGTAVDQTINGKFENCKFIGNNALRWCYAGETVEFVNCEFSGSVYGVHFDGGANEAIFRDCTFSGFNAFAGAITSLTLENCTFKSNGISGYNGANLWGSATLKGCKFIFDGSASYEWIDCIGADKAYSFENCTINGVDYTSDNYKSYLEYINSSSEVTVKINNVDCKLAE